MKKYLVGMLLLLLLAGCGKNEQKPTETAKDTEKTKVAEEKKPEKEAELKEMGKGIFYLANESGDTKEGKPIVIYADKDTVLLQIGVDTENMDGSKLSYIYIDGKLFAKEQLANTQTSLTLTEKELKEGMHQVVVKQYPNDDEKANPVTVKIASYQVKNK